MTGEFPTFEAVPWERGPAIAEAQSAAAGTLPRIGFALAVEALAGTPAPPRAQALRIVAGELERVVAHAATAGRILAALGDHLFVAPLAALGDEVGAALTRACGARRWTGFVVIGGVAHDLSDEAIMVLERTARAADEQLGAIERALARDALIVDRLQGCAAVDCDAAERAGLSGVLLRATGAEEDARTKSAALPYDAIDWEVVVGQHGDALDRLGGFIAEARQAARIASVTAGLLPEGSLVHSECAPPPRHALYGDAATREAYLHKQRAGIRPTTGSVRIAIEGSEGCFDFAVEADGGTSPARVVMTHPLEGLAVLRDDLRGSAAPEEWPLIDASLGLAAEGGR